MSASPPAAVFDLDGTLVDTAPDILGTLNAVLGDLGLAPIGLAEVRAMIGDGIRALLERGLAAQGAKLDEAAMAAADERFLRHYADNLARESRPFPGVWAALAELEEAGFRLAVCTNKAQEFALPLLGQLGLRDRFASVIGGDFLAVRKPDPRHLLEAIRAAGARPEGSVMIGDSRNDVAVARAAGLPVVLVSFGYTPVPAAELGADAVIDRYADLGAAIRQVQGR